MSAVLSDSQVVSIPGKHQTRRVGAIDRPWHGHWSALVITPVQTPSVEDLRALLLRLLREQPTAALASRIDSTGSRWLQVPEEQHAVHAARVVVAVDDPNPDALEDHVQRHRPPLDSDLPLMVLVGPQSMTIFFSHLAGDGATFSQLMLKLVRADYDGVAAFERPATTATVLQAFRSQLKPHFRDWANQALPSKSSDAVTDQANPEKPPAGTVKSVPRPPGSLVPAQPMVVGSVITNAELRELTKWRNQNARGISITSLLTAAVYRSLTQHDLQINGEGFYSLIDIRRYLPKTEGLLPGNLAKSLYLVADMSSPEAISQASQRAVDTARAVPAMVAGAGMTLLKGNDVHESELDGPRTIAFSSMPNLPGLADLPWTDPAAKRHFGFGYPTGRLGISIFAVRLREHMEVTASFDASTGNVEVVRDALRELGDSPGLLSASTR